MTKTKTVQQVAEEIRSKFVLKERPKQEGQREPESYWSHEGQKSGTPAWELTFYVHEKGDIFPDDYRYEYIVNALDIITDNDPESWDEIRDQIESDVYNHDLLKWFASNNDRTSYVDDAADEYGFDRDRGVMQLIALGQIREKTEVFDHVKAWIENYIKEQE